MNRLFRILFVLCLIIAGVASWTRIVGDPLLSSDAPEWMGARDEVRGAVTIPATGGYTFYVLGDVQQGLGAFRKALSHVSKDHESRFAVMAGDLVTTGGGARYRALFDAAARQGSSVPMLTVPGNHDLPEDYTRFLGPLAWHVRAGPDLLIGLDNSRRNLDDGELRALEELLGRSDARNRFVFLHRPLIKGQSPKPPLARLLRILEKGGVRWIFAGHRHTFEVRTNGRLSECVNGCGGDMSGPFPVSAYLARIRVDSPKLAVELVDLGKTWELDALMVSTFVVHWYSPWRESGRWVWAMGLLLVFTLFAGGVGYGSRVLLPALALSVVPLWPGAGLLVASVAVCALGARLLRA